MYFADKVHMHLTHLVWLCHWFRASLEQITLTHKIAVVKMQITILTTHTLWLLTD